MSGMNTIRKTFIAGLFSFVPLAITIYLLVLIDQNTRALSKWAYGREIPYVGVLLSIAAIYACGIFVTSFLGRYLLRILDRIITQVPIIKDVYTAWKQVALTPAGTEGMYSRVVLVQDNQTDHYLLGFTSGQRVPGGEHICVFLPNCPNPVVGRLILVLESECKPLNMSADEAFKLIISTGNYIPEAVGQGLKLTQ